MHVNGKELLYIDERTLRLYEDVLCIILTNFTSDFCLQEAIRIEEDILSLMHPSDMAYSHFVQNKETWLNAAIILEKYE